MKWRFPIRLGSPGAIARLASRLPLLGKYVQLQGDAHVLLDIASAPAVENPASQLQQVYEWRIERSLTEGRLALTAAGSLAVAFAAAALDSEKSFTLPTGLIVGAGVLSLVALGIWRTVRANRLADEFPRALAAMERITPIAGWVARS